METNPISFSFPWAIGLYLFPNYFFFFYQANLFLERVQVVSFYSKKGFQSLISSLENPILPPRSRSLHYPPQLQESTGDMELFWGRKAWNINIFPSFFYGVCVSSGVKPEQIHSHGGLGESRGKQLLCQFFPLCCDPGDTKHPPKPLWELGRERKWDKILWDGIRVKRDP